jgi:hypothetical protein
MIINFKGMGNILLYYYQLLLYNCHSLLTALLMSYVSVSMRFLLVVAGAAVFFTMITRTSQFTIESDGNGYDQGNSGDELSELHFGFDMFV